MLAEKNLLQILTVSLLAAPLAASAAPTYCAKLLGNFSAYDLGNNGEVLGLTETATGYEAAIWKNGTITRYGTLGGSRAWFASISSNGRIAGNSDIFGDRTMHAFIYENGAMRDIGEATEGSTGAASINASGEVAGQIGRQESTKPFVYSKGVLSDIGNLGGRWSSASGINDAGIAVGTSDTASDANGRYTQYAFVYRDGVMKILTAPGWRGSGASKINNAGEIVGHFERERGVQGQHAFLYSRGVMHEIDTIGSAHSDAFDINDRRQVVGQFIPTQGATGRAFLYENGKMRDLNGMVRGIDGRNLDHALAINNRGQILAYACSDSLGCENALLDPAEDACGHSRHSCDRATERRHGQQPRRCQRDE